MAITKDKKYVDPREFAYQKGYKAYKEWRKTDQTKKVRVPYRSKSGGFRRAFITGWGDAKARIDGGCLEQLQNEEDKLCMQHLREIQK